MEKVNNIATKFDSKEFVTLVFDIVPKEYRCCRLDVIDWSIKELKRGAFYYYINYLGQLDWAFRFDSDSELYNVQVINNEAFLHLLRCIYGNSKKPVQ